MSKFKVGDKVRKVREVIGDNVHMKIGGIGIIRKDRECQGYIGDERGYNLEGSDVIFLESQLELVESTIVSDFNISAELHQQVVVDIRDKKTFMSVNEAKDLYKKLGEALDKNN